jgi:hypothetical protein
MLFLPKQDKGGLEMSRMIWVLPLLLLITGCGAQMRNLPVGKGRTVVNTSVGGPLVNVMGATLPVPYMMVGATHGLGNRLDIYGDLHVLAAMFRFAGFTPGLVYYPPFPVPGLVPSINVDALTFSDLNRVRIFPELTVACAMPSASRWTPYLGFHGTFQTTKQPVFLPSLFGGASYRAGRFRIYGELEWLAINRRNIYTPVEYQGISRRGAIGTQLGISMDLSRRAR